MICGGVKIRILGEIFLFAFLLALVRTGLRASCVDLDCSLTMNDLDDDKAYFRR